jgi:hypothetical protein
MLLHQVLDRYAELVWSAPPLWARPPPRGLEAGLKAGAGGEGKACMATRREKVEPVRGWL